MDILCNFSLCVLLAGGRIAFDYFSDAKHTFNLLYGFMVHDVSVVVTCKWYQPCTINAFQRPHTYLSNAFPTNAKLVHYTLFAHIRTLHLIVDSL